MQFEANTYAEASAYVKCKELEKNFPELTEEQLDSIFQHLLETGNTVTISGKNVDFGSVGSTVKRTVEMDNITGSLYAYIGLNAFTLIDLTKPSSGSGYSGSYGGSSGNNNNNNNNNNNG